MTTVFIVLMAAGGLSLFGMAVAAFIRWPALVLYVVGAAALLAWDFASLPSLFSVGGTQVKPEDAVVVSAVTATALRPTRFLAVTRHHNPLMILIFLCLGTALVVGSIHFGNSAFNEFRGFFWPIGLTAWTLNQDWQSERMQAALQRWATLTGLGLSVLFLYHAAVYGMGTADSFVVQDDGTEQTGRPLVSGQALLLTLIGMFKFKESAIKGRGGHAWLGAIFMALAILCQHRSVWLAVGIGIVLVLFRLRGVALARTLVGGFYASVLCLALYASGWVDSIVSSFLYSFDSTGTYNARLDTWSVLIDDSIQRGPYSVIFGEPFGFGYDRYDGTRLLTFAPHNWYVSVYLRLGLVGLAAFAIVLLSTLSRLVKLKAGIAPTSILLSIAVYAWSYSLPYYLAPMLGWCIALAWYKEPEKVEPKLKKGPALPDSYKHLATRRAASAGSSVSSGRRTMPNVPTG